MLIVFTCIFTIGVITGPFLEPPSDPIDHLLKTKKICDQDSLSKVGKNKGYWHYSLNSVFLYRPSSGPIDPEAVLLKIDLLHGLYCGLLAASLFILAQAAGLPSRWSFFSVLCCFLFFGTNRFSYFSYYSFGPSFTSMAIYWLWTALFFFRKRMIDVLWGGIAGLVILPILWMNHYQEAAFLLIIMSIYLFVNVFGFIWSKDCPAQNWCKPVFLVVSALLLFIIPQISIFQEAITSTLFPQDFWSHNSEKLSLQFAGLHLIGKFWLSGRINDTLGIAGYLPITIAVVALIPGVIPAHVQHRGKIIILGILPFIVFFIPLLHFFWVSSVKIPVYYRICYASMSWLTVSYFLYAQEDRIVLAFRRFNLFVMSKRIYFIICFTCLILFSTIRSAPVYGKADFILVDSKKWWKEWRPMITSVLEGGTKPIYTDIMTTRILYSLGFQVHRKNLEKAIRMRCQLFDISKMERIADKSRYNCLINLHSFTPTWVPEETGHWHSSLSDPSRYYTLDGKTGGELSEYLKEYPLKNIVIFD
jgi:hypothetical protein